VKRIIDMRKWFRKMKDTRLEILPAPVTTTLVGVVGTLVKAPTRCMHKRKTRSDLIFHPVLLCMANLFHENWPLFGKMLASSFQCPPICRRLWLSPSRSFPSLARLRSSTLLIQYDTSIPHFYPLLFHSPRFLGLELNGNGDEWNTQDKDACTRAICQCLQSLACLGLSKQCNV
jgi:hypothetical protein